MLLAYDVPAGAIAVVRGTIPFEADSTTVTFSIDPGHFAGSDPRVKPVLSLTSAATDGSTAELPGFVTVSTARGDRRVAVRRVDSDTVVTALGPGRYAVKVNGRPGADVLVGVYLAGDADADGLVGVGDRQGIRGDLGGSAGAPGVAVGSDANGDGRVNPADLRLARRNGGTSTSVRALTLVGGIDPSQDPNSDEVVAAPTADFVGRTLPNTLVKLTGGPVALSTMSDASGAYRFNGVPLAMGTNDFVASGVGAMGQSVDASLSATRVADLDVAMTSAQRMAKFDATDIRGLCYTPQPSDDILVNSAPPPVYFDSDFWNLSFTPMWSSQKQISGFVGNNGRPVDGRGDLAMIQSLGVNFLHLYDWGSQRDHTAFLQTALADGIRVNVPISNYIFSLDQNTVDPNAGRWVTQLRFIHDIFNQVYPNLGQGDTTPNPAISMWMIANEPDYNNFDPIAVAQVAQMLVYLENQAGIPDGNRLPIAIPLGWGTSWRGYTNSTPSVAAVEALYDAFNNSGPFQATDLAFGGSASPVTIPTLPADFFTSRYVWANNPIGNDNSFFLGLKPLPNYGPYYAPRDASTKIDWKALPMFFTEDGMSSTQAGSSPAYQAQVDQQQLADVAQARSNGQNPYFYGACVFQSLDQIAQKTGSETGFGIQTFQTGSFLTITNGAQIPVPPGAQGARVWRLDTLVDKPALQVVRNAFLK